MKHEEQRVHNLHLIQRWQDISKRPQGEERLDADRHLQRQRPPHDRRTATITHTTSTRLRTRHNQSGTRQRCQSRKLAPGPPQMRDIISGPREKRHHPRQTQEKDATQPLHRAVNTHPQHPTPFTRKTQRPEPLSPPTDAREPLS